VCLSELVKHQCFVRTEGKHGFASICVASMRGCDVAVVEEMHACMRAYTCRARGTSMPPLLLSGIRVLGRQNLSTPGRVVDDNHRASNPIGPGAFRRATSLKSSCAMVICSISVAVPARSKLGLQFACNAMTSACRHVGQCGGHLYLSHMPPALRMLVFPHR